MESHSYSSLVIPSFLVRLGIGGSLPFLSFRGGGPPLIPLPASSSLIILSLVWLEVQQEERGCFFCLLFQQKVPFPISDPPRPWEFLGMGFFFFLGGEGCGAVQSSASLCCS